MNILEFFRSFVGKSYDPTGDIELAEESKNIAGIFLLTLAGAKLTGSEWVKREPGFVAGYLQGFSDIIAQASGRPPGSMLGTNIALQFAKVVLEDSANDLINSFVEFSLTASGERFSLGLSLGERDGKGFIQKKSNLPRALVDHFNL